MEFNPNLIILVIVVGAAVYWRLKMLQKANKPVTYTDYLIKLARITNKNPFEFFKIAGEKDDIPLYMIKQHWQEYIKDNSKMPDYVKEFLKEGKEYIEKEQVLI